MELPLATAAIVTALVADHLLGEPRRHPLALFGRAVQAVEARWYAPTIRRGAVLAGLLVVPPALAAGWLAALPGAGWFLEVALLWLAVGGRSLTDHAGAVAAPLARGDLAGARSAVAMLVSRDPAALEADGIAAATTESVLENGNDAVIAALFWYLVAGAAGLVAFRLINTLDAMWGYRTERYDRFGRVAARADDLLGWLPARLTAAAYAVAGNTSRAIRCWRTQGRRWKSPNAGPVMAAGAGALGIRLGGPAPYHGRTEVRPALGEGRAATADDIHRAGKLLGRAVIGLVGVALVVELLLRGWA
ncbi:adenosylcobinamide-phosphate synthase [Thiohalospira halophila DSM 15071]|uniref:Cobalamin biosynthesis protein CobD n=1 Tax=Thiohalospira halophila DSM 15071 TaxID=1123397 RepID=A0A1I1T3X3_9GAMM|nr:adenosylcobinamide-phosphate synthase [Thiohalospira halophila DSM 15071]